MTRTAPAQHMDRELKQDFFRLQIKTDTRQAGLWLELVDAATRWTQNPASKNRKG
ncbi:MAG: hypothetical protein HY735_18600 [Verrucomicrobia bacterium]|nr:hypothetical protein [Verrucomicrobiota bacterium]